MLARAEQKASWNHTSAIIATLMRTAGNKNVKMENVHPYWGDIGAD